MLGLLCIGAAQLEAQNMSWSKHAKLADELYEQGKYGEAAENYQAAYTLKDSKKDLIYRAGECYLIIRNYEKAAAAFAQVQDKVKEFPLVGLQYGRALKQSGQYDAALQAFSKYISSYKGDDVAVVREIVQNEGKGCELAKEQAANPASVDFKHIAGSVNSPQTDFSPFPIGQELYFSSTKDGDKARIYKSTRQGDSWGAPITAEQFRAFEGQHYCNAAFSPDKQRIYFTVCESVENWGYLTSRCELYMTKKSGSVWSQAQRLPSSINMDNYTATQPNVVHENGKEILYFASNRPNGQGGMDIWYAVRNIDGGDLSFAEPVNAGPKINTLGNEITPFYDAAAKTLYFSSNGQVTTGGYDIFKIEGRQNSWKTPINIGLPFNSPADDYFYVQDEFGSMGYLASNRLMGTAKTSTEHEDIFSFMLKPSEVVLIAGTITDEDTEAVLQNVTVSMYEILDGEREKFITTKISEDGNYSFETMTGRTYKITAHKEGYPPATVTFIPGSGVNDPPVISLSTRTEVVSNTNNPGMNTPRPNMNNGAFNNEISPSRETVVPPPPSNEEYVYTPSTPGESTPLRTTAPRLTGTYYKVQLIAVSTFDEGQSRYNGVRNLGRLDTEFIVEKNVTRVLLGDYMAKEEAFDMLNEVKQNGFSGAFVVRYQDGERMGMLRQ